MADPTYDEDILEKIFEQIRKDQATLLAIIKEQKSETGEEIGQIQRLEELGFDSAYCELLLQLKPPPEKSGDYPEFPILLAVICLICSLCFHFWTSWI